MTAIMYIQLAQLLLNVVLEGADYTGLILSIQEMHTGSMWKYCIYFVLSESIAET